MDHAENETQELIARAQRGDQDAMGALFERFGDRVFRYIRMRVSDTASAEDITQTVFLEMVSSLLRYKQSEKAKFSTWLFQIARHRLIDHYRRSRPTAPIDELPERIHPNLSVDPAETDGGRIAWAMAQLSERYQTVLHLRFREDLDPAEIATVLGTSALNVRVMQHRALKALRVILKTNALP